VDPRDLSLPQQQQFVQLEEFGTQLSTWDSQGFQDHAQEELEFNENALNFSEVSILWKW
jgi:hypothetical protein